MPVGQTLMRITATAIWILFVTAPSSRAQQSTAIQKIRMESLSAIPKEAELVCESTMAGENSEFGFPSNELYVADSAGGHLTRVTHNKRLYNHFAVSPNRQMIAANRYDQGDSNKNGSIELMDQKTLWVIDLEHKQEWALVPQYQAGWGGIDWTPDGEFIITSITVDGLTDIYRIRPDGTGMENLTKKLPKLLGVPRHNFVSDVSVSFDGKWITFLYNTRRSEPNRIAVMRIDGSAAHFVTDGGGAASKRVAQAIDLGDYDPEFSPDGQYICFQRTNGQNRIGMFATTDVMRIKIDGSDLRRLSPADNRGIHGISDWSADNRIVFSEWNEVDRWTGTVLVNADGSNYHRVEKLKGCTHVRWIP